MENQSISFTVTLGVFPWVIYFSFAETDQQIQKYLRRAKVAKDEWQHIEYPSDLAHGLCTFFSCGGSVVRMKKIPECIDDLSTLHHEITHIVFVLLDKMGISHGHATTEIYAYTTGHIVEKVYQNIPMFKSKTIYHTLK